MEVGMDWMQLDRLRYLGYAPRTLLDIGANIGTFSRNFISFFPGCIPTLVEANPYCEQFLSPLGFEYYRCAASDKRGSAIFNLNKDDLTSTGASLYRENTIFFSDDKLATIDVDLMPLDELFQDRCFDFVKIDVQGAELDVIRGARNILRHAEHVLIELSLIQYNIGSPLANVVIAAMQQLGFRLDRVLEYHTMQDMVMQIDFLFVPEHPQAGQRVRYSTTQNRAGLMQFLAQERERSPAFTVIDIGASAYPFSRGLIDATFDKYPCDAASLHFSGNLNKESDYAALLEHVARHGRFSYAICSHTLEDLAYPAVLLKYLPLIAENGFIAVPSADVELRRMESDYRGYIHHRWIIDPVFPSGQLVFYPKVSLIEQMGEGTALQRPLAASDPVELQIYWHRTVDYIFINEDYLGPTPDAVVEMYRPLFAKF
jgi:FkbM family methyltransferase